MAVEISSYELRYDAMEEEEYYFITGIVDGLPFKWAIAPRTNAEVAGVWDETTALAYLSTNQGDLLLDNQSALELNLVSFNRSTNEIELAASTATPGTQTANDFLTESPALPADAAEAKAWLEAEMANPGRKSHVLMTFCQYMMAFDHTEFKDDYLTIRSNMEAIKNGTAANLDDVNQAFNKIANAVDTIALALKKMVVGT